jgi:hypothetical protein
VQERSTAQAGLGGQALLPQVGEVCADFQQIVDEVAEQLVLRIAASGLAQIGDQFQAEQALLGLGADIACWSAGEDGPGEVPLTHRQCRRAAGQGIREWIGRNAVPRGVDDLDGQV